MAAPIKSDDVQTSVMPTVTIQKESPTYYANHAEAYHNQHEFGLAFAHVPAKISPTELERIKKSHTLAVDAVAVIILPPTVVRGLISALTAQLALYEQNVGSIPQMDIPQ